MGFRMSPLERVKAELEKYEHVLLKFSARETGGGVELVIELKEQVEGAHVYVAPVHERDVGHPQFEWTFQKYLYDCLHDYLCEMFTKNPQQLNAGEGE